MYINSLVQFQKDNPNYIYNQVDYSKYKVKSQILSLIIGKKSLTTFELYGAIYKYTWTILLE